MRHLYRVHRFGDGADLVQLDEDGVAASVLNAFDEAFGVRDEQVIADELHVFAEFFRQMLPAFPIFFVETVFDGNDRIFFDERFPVRDEFARRKRFAAFGLFVFAFFAALPFGRSRVHGEQKIFSRSVAGFFDRFEDRFDRFVVACEIGRKSAFVADGRRKFFRF